MVAAVGLGSEYAVPVEMEFSISAIVDGLPDDPAVEVTVTGNGESG